MTLFSVAAATTTSRDWLLATLDQAVDTRRQVSAGEVDALHHTFAVWNEMDVLHGGGHARRQLTALPRQRNNGNDVHHRSSAVRTLRGSDA